MFEPHTHDAHAKNCNQGAACAVYSSTLHDLAAHQRVVPCSTRLQPWSPVFPQDPIGVLPVFVTLTAGAKPADQRLTAVKAALVSGIILMLTAFGGKALFEAIGISMPAFRVSQPKLH